MAKNQHSFIYTFNYDYHHEGLCKMESRQIFGTEVNNKFLFSSIKIDPSISPFIKNRLDIVSSSADYSEFLKLIKQEKIELNGFMVDYLKLEGDSLKRTQRREKVKDVGYCIEGGPDFDNPSITYAICNFEGIWYFGVLTKENVDWHKHRQKPHSFSNSIGMIIAKTLVTLASKGDKTSKLLDACCGVGTVILEACISGFQIEGCDLNLKAYEKTIKNLDYYKYPAKVYHSDVQDINTTYDAAIIDLPYNLYSHTNDKHVLNIITSTARLTPRLVIVSISDIEDLIIHSGLKITDFCTVEKRGKSQFIRKIWVCEKESTVSKRS